MGNTDVAGKCFIWETSAEIKDQQGVVVVDSPRAGGKYCASGFLPELDDTTKTRLTSWLIKQRLLGVRCPKVDSKTIKDGSCGRVLGITERADRLLQLIELKSPAMGYLLNYYTENSDPGYHANYEEMLAWSESTNVSEIRSLLDYLEYLGRVEASINSSGGDVRITAVGCAHLEEMEKTATDSSQAFVAIWFDKSMSETWEKGIKSAIRDSGYGPFRVDETEHIGRIDDRIIAGIRRSRFIVADFTHDKEKGVRGNVYYEAGFAHGFGIPVIFTCRKDLIKEVPFDTRQYNHIVWDTAEDLRNKLANRISAVIGDGPIKRNP